MPLTCRGDGGPHHPLSGGSLACLRAAPVKEGAEQGAGSSTRELLEDIALSSPARWRGQPGSSLSSLGLTGCTAEFAFHRRHAGGAAGPRSPPRRRTALSSLSRSRRPPWTLFPNRARREKWPILFARRVCFRHFGCSFVWCCLDKRGSRPLASARCPAWFVPPCPRRPRGPHPALLPCRRKRSLPVCHCGQALRVLGIENLDDGFPRHFRHALVKASRLAFVLVSAWRWCCCPPIARRKAARGFFVWKRRDKGKWRRSAE